MSRMINSWRRILQFAATAVCVISAVSIDARVVSGRADTPTNLSEFMTRGKNLLRQKNFNGAIGEFNKALKINPKSTEAFMGRGTGWIGKKSYNMAIADFTRSLTIDPDFVPALRSRSFCYTQMKLFDKAIADLDKAIKLLPESADLYVNRASVWSDLKDNDKAIADLTKALELKPDQADFFTLRGNEWESKREYDKAIADYTKAVQIDPNYAFAYNNRGNCWTAKNEFDKAIADYDKAIELDPNYTFAYANRGNAWRELNEFDKARSDYNRAIAIDPRYSLAYFQIVVFGYMYDTKIIDETIVRQIKNCGPKDQFVIYSELYGRFAAQKSGRPKLAKKYLDDAATSCDPKAWPYPVIKYLREEIDENAALAAATDLGQKTEAHCYLGLDLAYRGRKDAAIEHFRWVEQNGVRTFSEYEVAIDELKEIDASNKPEKARGAKR